MRVIGLTGSIACGKSTISRYLISLGFPVVDGDQISRELTAPGSPVLDEIRHNFGDRFINDNGNLNRRALGALVFQNDHARSRLDAIMAPHLERLTAEKIELCRSEGASLCFLDMPLLFEKGYDRFCDSVWTVWLPESIQLSRLTARDHLSEEDAMKRIRAVMSSDEKASRADCVIDNSGPVRHTLSVVDRLLQSELNPSAGQDPSRPVHFPAAPVRQITSSVSLPAAPQNNVSPPPAVMERPPAARRVPSERRTEWRIPFWMKTTLIIVSALFVFSIAAFGMMSGYLTRQYRIHQEEQDHIRVSYHFDDIEKTYREWIEKYADEYNLKPAFVAGVIMSESSFRPDVSSRASARGLMQLMKDTATDRARDLRIPDFTFDMAYDPELNIRLGCSHLSYLVRKFGNDLPTVMVAYNVGEGNVSRNWLSNPSVSIDGRSIMVDGIPDINVKQYVLGVAQNYGIYQKQFYPDTSSVGISDSSGPSSR